MIVEDMRREMMRRIAAASKKSDERGREGEREKGRKRWKKIEKREREINTLWGSI